MSQQSTESEHQELAPIERTESPVATSKKKALIIGGVLMAIVIIAGVALVFDRPKSQENTAQNTNTTQVATNSPSISQSPLPSPSSQAKSQKVTWRQGPNGYEPEGTPPACPTPMISTLPADITKVTSVLYPGQFRGTYKSHGGLRFDTSLNTDIRVTAPFDGTIVAGAITYAEGMPDVQYNFNVMNDCGMMFIIGHLYTLSPAMAEVAKNLPAPIVNDSRNTAITTGVTVKAGDLLATAVGTVSDKNTFFDFGVYDWNKPNTISSDTTWLADSRRNNVNAKYGVCWLNLLSETDKSALLAISSKQDAASKKSDYCN